LLLQLYQSAAGAASILARMAGILAGGGTVNCERAAGSTA
jgi:ABC-type cobalamin transport system ATPase subunit